MLTLQPVVRDLRLFCPDAGDPHCGGILLRSRETRHSVIRQMYAIGAFVDKQGCRRVRICVGNMLRHFFHDERVADDETNDSLNRPCPRDFRQHLTQRIKGRILNACALSGRSRQQRRKLFALSQLFSLWRGEGELLSLFVNR